MENESKSPERRGIRSFVLRAGRLTPAQQQALDELLPAYSMTEGNELVSFSDEFGREAETILEIGFGNGEATWKMAKAEPENNFIGIEVHPPGVGHLLRRLHEHEIANVRVVMLDAVPFLAQRIPDNSLSGLRIYFPDPWPKKRHHKRRLVQPEFIRLAAQKMRPGGVLHFATDWQPYADHMLEVMQSADGFTNQSDSGDYVPHPSWRPATKYEARGDRLGHESRDLVFIRNND